MSALESALRAWDEHRHLDEASERRLLVTADAHGFHVWRIRGGEGVDPTGEVVLFRCDEFLGSARSLSDLPAVLRLGLTRAGA